MSCGFVYFQKEYYTTHQLFLTHRALYLAIWKLTDGEEGVRNLYPWLLNIQVCYAALNEFDMFYLNYYDFVALHSMWIIFLKSLCVLV